MSAEGCRNCGRPVTSITDTRCERCAAIETLRHEHERGRHAGGLGAKVAKHARSLGVACPHMKRATAMADEYPELQREQAAFDAQLDDMLREHAGEFVIFKDGAPVGFFATYDEAYREALAKFGPDEAYLVSEVKRREPQVTSLAWAAGVMFR